MPSLSIRELDTLETFLESAVHDMNGAIMHWPSKAMSEQNYDMWFMFAQFRYDHDIEAITCQPQ